MEVEISHAHQQNMMLPPDDSGILDETIEPSLNTTPNNAAPGRSSSNVIHAVIPKKIEFEFDTDFMLKTQGGNDEFAHEWLKYTGTMEHNVPQQENIMDTNADINSSDMLAVYFANRRARLTQAGISEYVLRLVEGVDAVTKRLFMQDYIKKYMAEKVKSAMSSWETISAVLAAAPELLLETF